MPELIIHVDIGISRGLARAVLTALLLGAPAPELGSESVGLTTSYPAPSGVYNQLLTTGQTILARDGASTVAIGTTNPGTGVKLHVDGNIRSTLVVNGITGLMSGGNVNWAGGSLLSLDQSGSIELGGGPPSSGKTPYIDFHYGNGLGQDYNARLINPSSNMLSVVTAFGGTVMTVASTKLGVGTTAPEGTLDISRSDGTLVARGGAGCTTLGGGACAAGNYITLIKGLMSSSVTGGGASTNGQLCCPCPGGTCPTAP